MEGWLAALFGFAGVGLTAWWGRRPAPSTTTTQRLAEIAEVPEGSPVRTMLDLQLQIAVVEQIRREWPSARLRRGCITGFAISLALAVASLLWLETVPDASSAPVVFWWATLSALLGAVVFLAGWAGSFAMERRHPEYGMLDDATGRLRRLVAETSGALAPGTQPPGG